MAVIIKIPTWCTFNRFPAGSPAEGLAVLGAVFGTTFNAGDSNPVWADLQDLDLGGGPLTRGSSLTDLSTVTPISNTSFLTLGQVQLAVAVGGDVEGMNVYFEVESLTDGIPVSFPNRTYMDGSIDPEDPIERVHTWLTWYDGMPGHDPIGPFDGKYYCSSANTWNGGRPIDASAWVPAGLTVKTVAEVQAIQASLVQ